MADKYTPEELKQAEALYNKGLTYSEIENELQKQKVLTQTPGDVALRVGKGLLSPLTGLWTAAKAAVPGTNEHEAAIQGVSTLAQHPIDSLSALAASLAHDPQTGQFDPGAMGESFGGLLGGAGLAKISPNLPSVRGMVAATSRGARNLAASPEAAGVMGRAGGTIVGTAVGHPLAGYVAGETLKPVIRGAATKFADLLDVGNRPIGSLLGQNKPPVLAARVPDAPPAHELQPAREPQPVSPNAGSSAVAEDANLATRLQEELRARGLDKRFPGSVKKVKSAAAFEPQPVSMTASETGHLLDPNTVSMVDRANAMKASKVPKQVKSAPKTFADLVDSMTTVDKPGPNASAGGTGSQEENFRNVSMKAAGKQFVVRNRAGQTRPSTVDGAMTLRPGEEFGEMGPNGFQLLNRGGQ